MNKALQLFSGATLMLALVGVGVGVAGAQSQNNRSQFGFGGANHVVFVQTDNTAGNQVVAYDRADNGQLSLADTYNTGGLGGVSAGRWWTTWPPRALWPTTRTTSCCMP